MRGAWVEIAGRDVAFWLDKSLPVRGAWVEMRYALPSGYKQGGRSPCGERGLKYKVYDR